MPPKRKADDIEENDSERPTKVTKTGEGGDVSGDLASLEAEAENAKKQAAKIRNEAAAVRREKKKKDRLAGIEPKRTRRKKDQAEPDYAKLAIEKAKESQAKNKDTAKGARAGNSCIRCAARKAKCSDGPGPCTACVLDGQSCLMLDKSSLETYVRGELTTLRDTNKRLRTERDAYRRIYGDLPFLEHTSPLPENRALGSNSHSQSTPAGAQTGSGGINTPGSMQGNQLSTQTQDLRQFAPVNNSQLGVPQYQQSQTLGQYSYTQAPQNPYQSYAPQHLYQQPGPYPAQQQQYPQQQQQYPHQLSPPRQPLGFLQQPFLGNLNAPTALAPAPGTIAPEDTQVYDGADLYGDGSEPGAQYELVEESDLSAHSDDNSQNQSFDDPEYERMAALLNSARTNTDNQAQPTGNDIIDPQLLDRELGQVDSTMKTRRGQ